MKSDLATSKQYALGTVALTELAGDFHGFFPSWRTELEQMMIYSDFLNEIENRFILHVVCQLFLLLLWCNKNWAGFCLWHLANIPSLYKSQDSATLTLKLQRNLCDTELTETQESHSSHHTDVSTKHVEKLVGEKNNWFFWWNLTLHPEYWLTILDVFFQDRSKKKKKTNFEENRTLIKPRHLRWWDDELKKHMQIL